MCSISKVNFHDEISQPCYDDISEDDERISANNATKTDLKSSLLADGCNGIGLEPLDSSHTRGQSGDRHELNVECITSDSNTDSVNPGRERTVNARFGPTNVGVQLSGSTDVVSPVREIAIIINFASCNALEHSYVPALDLSEHNVNLESTLCSIQENADCTNCVDSATGAKKLKHTVQENLHINVMKERYKHIPIRDCSIVLPRIEAVLKRSFAGTDEQADVLEKRIDVQLTVEMDKNSKSSESSVTKTIDESSNVKINAEIVTTRNVLESVQDNSSRKLRSEKELAVHDAEFLTIQNVPVTEVRGEKEGSITGHSCEIDVSVMNLELPFVQGSATNSATDNELCNNVHSTDKTLKRKYDKNATKVQSVNKRESVMSSRKMIHAFNKQNKITPIARESRFQLRRRNYAGGAEKQRNDASRLNKVVGEVEGTAVTQPVTYQLARSESPLRRNCLAVASIRNADLLNPCQRKNMIIKAKKPFKKIPLCIAENHTQSSSPNEPQNETAVFSNSENTVASNDECSSDVTANKTQTIPSITQYIDRVEENVNMLTTDLNIIDGSQEMSKSSRQQRSSDEMNTSVEQRKRSKAMKGGAPLRKSRRLAEDAVGLPSKPVSIEIGENNVAQTQLAIGEEAGNNSSSTETQEAVDETAEITELLVVHCLVTDVLPTTIKYTKTTTKKFAKAAKVSSVTRTRSSFEKDKRNAKGLKKQKTMERFGELEESDSLNKGHQEDGASNKIIPQTVPAPIEKETVTQKSSIEETSKIAERPVRKSKAVLEGVVKIPQTAPAPIVKEAVTQKSSIEESLKIAERPVRKSKALLEGAVKIPFRASERKATKTAKSPPTRSILSTTTVAESVIGRKDVISAVPFAATTAASTGSNLPTHITDLVLLDNVNRSQEVQVQSVLINVATLPNSTRINLVSKTLSDGTVSREVRQRRYQCVFCSFDSIMLKEVTDHLVDTHHELLFCIINRPRSSTASMLQPVFTFCRHCNFVAVEMLPMWIHFDFFHNVSGILGLSDEEEVLRRIPAQPRSLPLMSLDVTACLRAPVYVCVDCSLWSMDKSTITTHIIVSHQDCFSTSNGFFVKLFELRKNCSFGSEVPTYRQLYSDAAYSPHRTECFICTTCLFVVYDSGLALQHYIVAHQPKKLVLACKQAGCTRVLYSVEALNVHNQSEHAEGGPFHSSRLASVTIVDSRSLREVEISMNRVNFNA